MAKTRALLLTIVVAACQPPEARDVGQSPNELIKDGTGGGRPNACSGAGPRSLTTIGGKSGICIQPPIYDIGNAPPSGDFPAYTGCCLSNGTCSVGYVCLDNACVQTCSTTTPCPSGQNCIGGRCMVRYPFAYHGGNLLNGLTTVYDVFMGAEWSGSLSTYESALSGGTQSIVTDPQFTNVINQYALSSQNYYGGAYFDPTAPRATVQNSGLGSHPEITESQIVTELGALLSNNNNYLPRPSASYRALYVIHLEDSNVILNSGTNNVTCLTPSCAVHGDFRWASPSGSVYEVPYVIIPNLDENSCRDAMKNIPSCPSEAAGEPLGFASMVDNMQYAKTHEIAEAQNDPNNGGWFSGKPPGSGAPVQFEVSDYCEYYSRRVDGFPTSPQWSAADNCCVIARPWPNLPSNLNPPTIPTLNGYDHQFLQLAAGVSGDGRIFVFGIAAYDHSVWHIEETALDSNQWGAWIPHSGLTAQQIAVTKESDGRLVVFAIDSSNAPHGGQPYAMRQSSPTGAFGSFVAMNPLYYFNAWQLDAKLDTQSGKIDVFIIDDTYRGVYHMEETTANSNTPGAAPTFNNWVSAGGYALALTLGQANDGRLVAYVIGGQQQPNSGWLYELHQTDRGTSSWTGYYILNQKLNQVWNNDWTTIGSGKYWSSLRVANASDGRAYVFTTLASTSVDLPSGGLYATIETSPGQLTRTPQSAWNAPQSVGVTPAGPYVATNEIIKGSFGNGWFTLPDKIDIFYPGRNNGIYQVEQTSSPTGTFGAPIFHGGYMYGLATATSAPSATAGGRIHLFAADPEFEHNDHCSGTWNASIADWNWTPCSQALVFNLTQNGPSGTFPQ
jgi:hypothetical protein